MPLTPEQHLLLAAIQRNPDGDEIAAALHGTVDWDGFNALAGMHGVLPMAYRTFHALQPAGLPRETRTLMQKKYQQNAVNSLRLLNLLFKTLDQFQKHNIAAFPFRGPVLSHMLYGDAAVRQCGDLDLIIRREDLEKAKLLLLDEGFITYPLRTPRQEAHYTKYFYSLTFVRERDNAMIDLHWNIASPAFSRYFNFEAIAARSQTITIGDHTIPVFGASDWLLCLCIHAAKHMWSRLLWLQDITDLVQSYKENLDWPAIIKNAKDTGDLRFLIISLMLCGDYFKKFQLDPAIEREFARDKQAVSARNSILAALFSRHDLLEQAMWKKSISYKTLHHLVLLSGFQTKLEYLKQKALFRVGFCIS